MRVKDEQAKAILACHGGQCPKDCPDYDKDFCVWVSEAPDGQHRELAADLLDARAMIREMINELQFTVMRNTSAGLSSDRAIKLLEKSKEFAE